MNLNVYSWLQKVLMTIFPYTHCFLKARQDLRRTQLRLFLTSGLLPEQKCPHGDELFIFPDV